MKNTHLPTMISLRIYISSILLICIFLLSGCMGSDNDADNSKEMINKAQGRADKITQQRNKDQQAWKDTQKRDTVNAYETYIKTFPEGKHVKEAESNIARKNSEQQAKNSEQQANLARLESERTKVLTNLEDSLEAAKVKFDDGMIGYSGVEWQIINGNVQEVGKYTSHLYLSDNPEVDENITKMFITKYINRLNEKLLVASDHLKKLSNASNVNDIKNHVAKLKASIAPETLKSVRPDSRLEEYIKSMPELEEKIRPPMQKSLKNARDYLSKYETIQIEIEKQLGKLH